MVEILVQTASRSGQESDALWIRNIGIAGIAPFGRLNGREIHPIGPSAIWLIVNQLYRRAGVLPTCPNRQNHKRKGPLCESCGYPDLQERRNKLSFHSLRWFIRTQLTSQGINPEYAEFMMGHKCKLYNDIRSKGPEFLRGEYMKADLSITPKPKLSDRQVIEALLRGRGFDPAKILRPEAFDNQGSSEPQMIYSEDKEQQETRRLADAFARSVLDEAHSILSTSSLDIGSPGEIRTPVDGSPPCSESKAHH